MLRLEVNQMKFKIFFLLLLFSLQLFTASAEERVALVIGNASYKSSPLRNPLNDARDMGNSLTALGFKVTTLINADQQEMFHAIRDFGQNLLSLDGRLIPFLQRNVLLNPLQI